MQTSFSLAQLADPDFQESNDILRACVHCGFCTATCPTYVTLGDERDSPRGRIYLIREMLQSGQPAAPAVVTHVDRCLSCLACMTTCPSGVHYMHLVDHARHYIDETFVRPWPERALRALLALVLPRPKLFRLALIAALAARPIAAWMPGRLKALMALAPRRLAAPAPSGRPRLFPARGTRRMRVALLAGCAQSVLAPEVNEATVRLLTRLGCDVVVVRGVGCCGALTHHMGLAPETRDRVKRNVAAWHREIAGAGLDAIVINASGCGTMVKDYGFLFRADADWSAKAAKVADIAVDISELVARIGLDGATAPEDMTIAYHAACSLQHGQRVVEAPKALLAAAGFTVKDVPEGHLCCGSAGTYNIMQPELAGRLRARKIANIESLGADAVAAGNIGCQVQIAAGTAIPVVHPVELLDWATGGPKPAALAD